MNYRERLHALIPGGAHTYSRGDDQFPSNAPAVLARGKGCYVWDADGNKYLDYGMGLRAVTVGYAYDPINAAAIAEIEKGNTMPRPAITELKAAEVITDLIPSADMVKFAKNGSTVTTAAVKLARAYTDRKYVAVCAEHPFFSYDDWFIGSTVVKRGIPEEQRELTLKFRYNDLASLEQLFREYPDQIAAVIMEAVTLVPPKDNFLHKVKACCQEHGTVFILDEMISGFRWHLQGAQTYFDVTPDLTTFGKGMANGFSLAALVGKRDIMELGGISKEGAERVFLISTTHGAELSALGAFIKTIDIYREHDIIGHLWSYGEKLISGMNDIAKELGIQEAFYVEGYPCSPNYVAKDRDGNISLALRTLFSQEMVRNGVLMAWMALSYAHKDEELETTLQAVKKSLNVYAKALDEGVDKYLEGKTVKPVFRERN